MENFVKYKLDILSFIQCCSNAVDLFNLPKVTSYRLCFIISNVNQWLGSISKVCFYVSNCHYYLGETYVNVGATLKIHFSQLVFIVLYQFLYVYILQTSILIYTV